VRKSSGRATALVWRWFGAEALRRYGLLSQRACSASDRAVGYDSPNPPAIAAAVVECAGCRHSRLCAIVRELTAATATYLRSEWQRPARRSRAQPSAAERSRAQPSAAERSRAQPSAAERSRAQPSAATVGRSGASTSQTDSVFTRQQ
jgi:hypothetical protein